MLPLTNRVHVVSVRCDICGGCSKMCLCLFVCSYAKCEEESKTGNLTSLCVREMLMYVCWRALALYSVAHMWALTDNKKCEIYGWKEERQASTQWELETISSVERACEWGGKESLIHKFQWYYTILALICAPTSHCLFVSLSAYICLRVHVCVRMCVCLCVWWACVY